MGDTCRHVITGLTHWGLVTHICVAKLTIIDSDNGLSPGRRQAIIWTNAGILLIGPLGTNFNEILIGIQTFSFKKMHLKMSSAKWRLFCLGLNVLTLLPQHKMATDIFKSFSWMKSFLISIPISPKFVPNGPIVNKSALVQVMAWRRTGDKPLPDPINVDPVHWHICSSRGKWVD